MDWLTFIASIVGSLAWPVLLVFSVLFIFFNRIVITKIFKSIRYKDFELVVRDFEAAKDLAEEIKSNQPPADPYDPTSKQHTLQLAKIDPGVAILRSWQRLEAEVVTSIQHSGLVRFTRPEKFIHRLFELNRLNNDELELYRRLRKIRNEVVHNPYGDSNLPTAAAAVEYGDFVDTMIQKLVFIREHGGYIDLGETSPDHAFPTSRAE